MADDFSLKAFCGFRGAELSESHEKERRGTREGESRAGGHFLVMQSTAAKGFGVTIQHSSFAHFIFIALAFRRLEAAP